MRGNARCPRGSRTQALYGVPQAVPLLEDDRRSLPALASFRARDDRQCSDTAASHSASPLDLPRMPRIIPAGKLHDQEWSSLRSLSSTTPDATTTTRIATAPTLRATRSPPIRHTRSSQPAHPACDHDDVQTSIKLTAADRISATVVEAACRPRRCPRIRKRLTTTWRRRVRDVPPQRRLLAHRNRRALTARWVGGCSLDARVPIATATAASGGTDSATTPVQLIDTRFTGQQFPVGNVVTLARPPPAHRLPRRHQDAPARNYLRRSWLNLAGDADATGGASSSNGRHAPIAHAIVGPGRSHDAVRRTAARRIGCTAQALQHRHAQPQAVDAGVPAGASGLVASVNA